jgi:hypothetical protein
MENPEKHTTNDMYSVGKEFDIIYFIFFTDLLFLNLLPIFSITK